MIDEIRAEIDEVIVKPYLKENPTCPKKDIMKNAINYENIWDLKKYTNSFSESMRIEPPVLYSSTNTVTEDL